MPPIPRRWQPNDMDSSIVSLEYRVGQSVTDRDLVVRARARHAAIILGDGWRTHHLAKSRARRVDDCALHELTALMDSARVAVNVQPNDRFAPHERLQFGMQRGYSMRTGTAAPAACRAWSTASAVRTVARTVDALSAVRAATNSITLPAALSP